MRQLLNVFQEGHVPSFEETYKTAYSHGLEAIYKLEDVDLSSVRPMEMKRVPAPIVRHVAPISEPEVPTSSQLELDFGNRFNGLIKPFVFQEPIQVLALSRHTEKFLLEQGVERLKDLQKIDFSEIAYIKGIGQGHIDEIRHKLHQYLEGRFLRPSSSIDFVSWLKSIVGDLERKKLFVALEPFHLINLFSLSPTETVEVRRLTQEKRFDWRDEVKERLQEKIRRTLLLDQMKKVVDRLLIPWMERRFGFARESELIERLSFLSESPAYMKMVFAFFRSFYFRGDSPFESCLIRLDEGLYCIDRYHQGQYEQIVSKTGSYFCSPSASYRLDQLVHFVEREFAKDWVSFPDGMVEKVLKLSPRFRVRKT